MSHLYELFLFYLVKDHLVPSIFLQTQFHTSLWLNNTPLYMLTASTHGNLCCRN